MDSEDPQPEEQRKIIISADFRGNIEAQDKHGVWYPAKVLRNRPDGKILIHFNGWNSRYDEWLDTSDWRLRYLANTEDTAADTQPEMPFQVDQFVLSKWSGGGEYDAKVIEMQPETSNKGKIKILVMYDDGVKKWQTRATVREMPPQRLEKLKEQLNGDLGNFGKMLILKPHIPGQQQEQELTQRRKSCMRVGRPDPRAPASGSEAGQDAEPGASLEAAGKPHKPSRRRTLPARFLTGESTYPKFPIKLKRSPAKKLVKTAVQRKSAVSPLRRKQVTPQKRRRKSKNGKELPKKLDLDSCFGFKEIPGSESPIPQSVLDVVEEVKKSVEVGENKQDEEFIDFSVFHSPKCSEEQEVLSDMPVLEPQEFGEPKPKRRKLSTPVKTKKAENSAKKKPKIVDFSPSPLEEKLKSPVVSTEPVEEPSPETRARGTKRKAEDSPGDSAGAEWKIASKPVLKAPVSRRTKRAKTRKSSLDPAKPEPLKIVLKRTPKAITPGLDISATSEDTLADPEVRTLPEEPTESEGVPEPSQKRKSRSRKSVPAAAPEMVQKRRTSSRASDPKSPARSSKRVSARLSAIAAVTPTRSSRRRSKLESEETPEEQKAVTPEDGQASKRRKSKMPVRVLEPASPNALIPLSSFCMKMKRDTVQQIELVPPEDESKGEDMETEETTNAEPIDETQNEEPQVDETEETALKIEQPEPAETEPVLPEIEPPVEKVDEEVQEDEEVVKNEDADKTEEDQVQEEPNQIEDAEATPQRERLSSAESLQSPLPPIMSPSSVTIPEKVESDTPVLAESLLSPLPPTTSPSSVTIADRVRRRRGQTPVQSESPLRWTRSSGSSESLTKEKEPAEKDDPAPTLEPQVSEQPTEVHPEPLIEVPKPEGAEETMEVKEPIPLENPIRSAIEVSSDDSFITVLSNSNSMPVSPAGSDDLPLSQIKSSTTTETVSVPEPQPAVQPAPLQPAPVVQTHVFKEKWCEGKPWLMYDEAKNLMHCEACRENGEVHSWAYGVQPRALSVTHHMRHHSHAPAVRAWEKKRQADADKLSLCLDTNKLRLLHERSEWLERDGDVVRCLPCAKFTAPNEIPSAWVGNGVPLSQLAGIKRHEKTPNHLSKTVRFYREQLGREPPHHLLLFERRQQALAQVRGQQDPWQKQEFACDWEGCGKVFRKQDMLSAHRRHTHLKDMPVPAPPMLPPLPKPKKVERRGRPRKRPLPEVVALGRVDIVGTARGEEIWAPQNDEEEDEDEEESGEEVTDSSEEDEDEEEEDSVSDFTDSSSEVGSVASELSDNDLVRCECGQNEENGFMIQCDRCSTWQHGDCFDIANPEAVPEPYWCYVCRNPPRIHSNQRYADQVRTDWYQRGRLAEMPQLSTHNSTVAPLEDRERVMLLTNQRGQEAISLADRVAAVRLRILVHKTKDHPLLALWENPESGRSAKENLEKEIGEMQDAIEERLDELTHSVDVVDSEWRRIAPVSKPSTQKERKQETQTLLKDLTKLRKLSQLAR